MFWIQGTSRATSTGTFGATRRAAHTAFSPMPAIVAAKAMKW